MKPLSRCLVLSYAIGSAQAFNFNSLPTSVTLSNFALRTSTVEDVSSEILGTPATSFDDGTCPFQITTPIYYVNDKPHIGHAYTSTACDVIARFMRLSGREVFFLSGTDEHGQKVEQSAEKKGVDPQDFVDEVSKSFRDLLDLMNVSNDKFIRTTSEEHKQSVQVRFCFNHLSTNLEFEIFTISQQSCAKLASLTLALMEDTC